MIVSAGKKAVVMLLAAESLLSCASAATGVAPPAMYPTGIWQGRSQAVIRVLDRLDSHVELLTVPVGSSMVYRTLSVMVQACVSRPPTLAADAAASLHLSDSADTAHPAFDGWILAAEPALSVYGNPVYDVRVVDCIGESVAPQAGPLPSPVTPQLARSAAQEEEGADAASAPDSEPSGPGDGAVPLAPPSNAPIPLAPQALPPPSPQGDPGLE